MNQQWKDKLTEAGYKWDGHSTVGSMQEQEKIIDQMLGEFVARLELISAQCLAGSHKSRARMFHALAKSFRVKYLNNSYDGE